MKKCVLILSFLIMTIGLSAQVYVGGNVSFSATAEDQTVDNTPVLCTALTPQKTPLDYQLINE